MNMAAFYAVKRFATRKIGDFAKKRRFLGAKHFAAKSPILPDFKNVLKKLPNLPILKCFEL